MFIGICVVLIAQFNRFLKRDFLLVIPNGTIVP